MKIKLLLTSVILLVAISTDAQERIKISDRILPAWFNEKNTDKWVGVSPPTTNQNVGRSVALVNAVLCYMRTQCIGRMKFEINSKIRNLQAGEHIESYNTLDSKGEVGYKGFDCDIIDEYCNKRGEYFVRCHIKNNVQKPQNRLLILKNHFSDAENNNYKESGTVNVTLELENETYRCDMDFNNKNRPYFKLSYNGEEIEPSENLKYDVVKWGSDESGKSLVLDNTELGYSLGIAQMATHTLIPFIPSGLEIKEDIMNAVSNEETDFIFVTSYKIDTICQPTVIVPISISEDGFTVKVLRTNMEDEDYNKILLNGEDEDLYVTNGRGFTESSSKKGYDRLFGVRNDIVNTLNVTSFCFGNLYDSPTINPDFYSTYDSFADKSGPYYISNKSSENKIVNIGVNWDFGTITEQVLKKTNEAFLNHVVVNDENVRGLLIKAGKMK